MLSVTVTNLMCALWDKNQWTRYVKFEKQAEIIHAKKVKECKLPKVTKTSTFSKFSKHPPMTTDSSTS